MGQLLIIGCGGFGREVFGLVEALSKHSPAWTFEGFIDDSPSSQDVARVTSLGSRVLGTVDHLARNVRTSPRESETMHAVVAIGSAAVRVGVVERLARSGIRWATLVHPETSIGPAVTIGEGSIVAAGARLSTNIRVGNHVHIDQNVAVGHDTVIGDFARLNPQACISGSVVIEHGALIGANATVLQGITIGSRAVLGASGCATTDVGPGVTVKGVPARSQSNSGPAKFEEEP